MAEATSSSSAPKSIEVAAARSASAQAPMQMEMFSSLPSFLALLYSVNRCLGTSLMAMVPESTIIILWKDTFLFPPYSATTIPDVM
jgi:hypothetical protein